MSLPSTGEISLSQINSIMYRSNTNCLIDKLSSSSRLGCRAAFSTRLLRSDYFGPIIRVRRSTDNAESDFYANENGQLGTSRYGQGTSLTSWLGGGTGFVRTWYDQSGSGAHVTQSTTTNQPTITLANGNSGTVITYDGSNDFLTGSTSYTYPPASLTSQNTILTNTGYADGTYVTSASTEAFSTSAFFAFDGNNSTIWHSATTYNWTTGVYDGGVSTTSITGNVYNGEWVQIIFPNSVRVTSYSIYPRSDGLANRRSPRNFVLLGSIDGTTWNLVDSETGITNWADNVNQTFSAATPGSFTHYRLVTTVVGNNSSGDQNSVQIASLQFFVNGIPLAAGDDTYTYMANWMTTTTSNTAVIIEQSSGANTSNARACLVRSGSRYGHNGEANDLNDLIEVRTNVTTKTVLVVNNNLSTNNVKIFHNGIPYHGTSQNPSLLAVATATFNIGRKDTNSEFHTGTINEVLVFENTLRDTDAMLYYTPTIGSVRPSGPFPKPRTWINFHPMDANTFHTMHGYRSQAALDLTFLQTLSNNSSISTWNGYTGANNPTYINSNGPVFDTGYVNFTRASSQHFNGGSRTLNITSNGGFSAVAMVFFSGTAGAWERIFDFANGQDNNNLVLARNFNTTTLTFNGRNGSTVVAETSSAASVIVQDTWMPVAVRYNASTRVCELFVNGIIYSSTGTTALTDRTISNSYIGRSNWGSDAYFQGRMTGVYIYDRLLSYDELATITNFLRFPTLTQAMIPQHLTEYSNVRISGPVFYERSRYNYASRFYGYTTTYIDVMDAPAPPMSFCFWFNASSNVFYEIVGLCDFNRNISGIAIQRNTSRELNFFVHNGSGYQGATGPVVNDNTWCHITVTLSSAQTQFYVNGTLNSTIAHTTAFNSRFIIGAGGEVAWGFNGFISDFRVYDYILRASDVTQIYDGENGSTFAPQIHPTNPENYLVTIRNWYTTLRLEQSGGFTPIQSGSDPNVQIQLANSSVGNTRNTYYTSNRIQDYQSFACSFEIYSSTASADGAWFFCGSTALPTGEQDSQSGFQVSFQVLLQRIDLINNSNTFVSQSNYSHWRDRGAWTPVTISYTRGNVNTWVVRVNGIDVITYSDPNNGGWIGTSGSLWGFAARNGNSTMNWYIRRVELSYTPYIASISNIAQGTITPLKHYPEAHLTANSSNNVTVSSSSIFDNNNAYLAFYAFDNNSATIWASGVLYNTSTGVYTGGQSTTISGTNVSGEWVQIQLPSAVILKSYSLTARFPQPGYNPPNSWVLAGSTNGTTWVLLDTELSIGNWILQRTQTFTASSSVAYNYYRFVFTVAGMSGEDRSFICLREVDLFALPIAPPQTSFSFFRSLSITPGLIDGLTWKFFNGNFNSNMIDDFETNTYTYIGRTTNTTNINTGTNGLVNINSLDNYSVEWVGYFRANVTGTWTFFTESDDGSYLWLGNTALSGYTTGNALVNNGGIHTLQEASGTISLTTGVYYPIRVRYSDGSGTDDCRISFQAPSGTRTYDGSGFYFSSTGANVNYPAESAKIVKDITHTNIDGVYYINVSGTSTATYCLMNDCYTGGGWMMLMKATRGTTFSFSSNYWTTSNTLNTSQTNRLDGDAKFAVFNNNTIKDVMAIFPDVPSLSYTNVYGRNGGSLNLEDGWCWKLENWNGSTRVTALSGFQSSRQATPSDPNVFNGYSTGVFSRQTPAARHVIGGGSVVSASENVRWGMLFDNFSVNNFISVDNFCGIGMSGPSHSAGDFFSGLGGGTSGLNRSMRVELYGR